MSNELLLKSLDFVDAGDGLDSCIQGDSSFLEDQPTTSKSKKKKSRKQALKRLKAADQGTKANHRSVFLPEKRSSGVKSMLEEAKEKPKTDYLRKNLRYLVFSDQHGVERGKLDKIVSNHSRPYEKRKKCLKLLKEMEEKEKGPKKENQSVFSASDFAKVAETPIKKRLR